jgi:hypothetical protein
MDDFTWMRYDFSIMRTPKECNENSPGFLPGEMECNYVILPSHRDESKYRNVSREWPGEGLGEAVT